MASASRSSPGRSTLARSSGERAGPAERGSAGARAVTRTCPADRQGRLLRGQGRPENPAPAAPGAHMGAATLGIAALAEVGPAALAHVWPGGLCVRRGCGSGLVRRGIPRTGQRGTRCPRERRRRDAGLGQAPCAGSGAWAARGRFRNAARTFARQHGRRPRAPPRVSRGSPCSARRLGQAATAREPACPCQPTCCAGSLT